MEKLYCDSLTTPIVEYRNFILAITDLVESADQFIRAKGSIGLVVSNPAITVDYFELEVGQHFNTAELTEDLGSLLNRPEEAANSNQAFSPSERSGGSSKRARKVLSVILEDKITGGLWIDGEFQNYCIGNGLGHVELSASVQHDYQLPLRDCYLSIHDLLTGLKNNEPSAVFIMRAYIDCIASYLAGLVVLLEPEVLLLGGKLSNIHELYQQLSSSLEENLPDGVSAPNIKAPKFGEASGVRGAVLLDRRRNPLSSIAWS